MPKTIKIKVNGEDVEIPIPNGFKLRKGCADCIKEQKICANLNGSLVCCTLELKQEKDGFSLFQIEPCSKFGNGKINI
jgi:hypothetical protein